MKKKQQQQKNNNNNKKKNNNKQTKNKQEITKVFFLVNDGEKSTKCMYTVHFFLFYINSDVRKRFPCSCQYRQSHFSRCSPSYSGWPCPWQYESVWAFGCLSKVRYSLSCCASKTGLSPPTTPAPYSVVFLLCFSSSLFVCRCFLLLFFFFSMTFVLPSFVPHRFFFWYLWKAVLRDCGISLVPLSIVDISPVIPELLKWSLPSLNLEQSVIIEIGVSV